MADTPTQIRAAAERAIAAIRTDATLSDRGRQLKLAAVKADTDRALAAARTADTEARQGAASAASRRLFGGDDISPAAAISKRDAADRASRIATPREARAWLQRAERSGDTDLERAILGRAIESGWGGIVDLVRSVRSEWVPDIDAVTSSGSPTERLARDATFTRLSVRELDGLDAHRIDKLAAEAGKEQ